MIMNISAFWLLTNSILLGERTWSACQDERRSMVFIWRLNLAGRIIIPSAPFPALWDAFKSIPHSPERLMSQKSRRSNEDHRGWGTCLCRVGRGPSLSPYLLWLFWMVVGESHFPQHPMKLTWLILPLMLCYVPVFNPQPPESLNSNLFGNSLTQERNKSECFPTGYLLYNTGSSGWCSVAT